MHLKNIEPMCISIFEIRSVIAVHGLAGNAFGSWAVRAQRSEEYTCWLRDFLAEDLPNIRVVTYGYEARLDRTTTVSRLTDYRRAFLLDVATLMTEIKVRWGSRQTGMHRISCTFI